MRRPGSTPTLRTFRGRRWMDRKETMGNTGPESPVRPAVAGGGGAGLFPAGAAACEGRA
jgi:hypothetical protein